jgi:hypothetical protein
MRVCIARISLWLNAAEYKLLEKLFDAEFVGAGLVGCEETVFLTNGAGLFETTLTSFVKTGREIGFLVAEVGITTVWVGCG